MQRHVTYNILTDGDKHLRGRIAKLIFERARSQLLERALYCCSTLDLYHFVNYDLRSIDASSINEKSLLSEYVKNLNAVWALLGTGKYEEVSNVLLSEDARKSLRRLCLFCLKESEACVHIWVNHSYRCPFELCSGCLYICVTRSGTLNPEADFTIASRGGRARGGGQRFLHACALTKL
jgi:hypothetical protein